MPDAKLLASEGRSYPVTIAYSAALAQRRSGSGSGTGMVPWLEHMGRQLLALLDPQQACALGVSEAQQQARYSPSCRDRGKFSASSTICNPELQPMCAFVLSTAH